MVPHIKAQFTGHFVIFFGTEVFNRRHRFSMRNQLGIKGFPLFPQFCTVENCQIAFSRERSLARFIVQDAECRMNKTWFPLV